MCTRNPVTCVRRLEGTYACCVYASFRALFSAGNTSISSASSSSRTTNVVMKSPEPPRGLATLDATSELADYIDNPDSPQLPVPAAADDETGESAMKKTDWAMTSTLDYQLQ